jgi:hypothetical protein
LRRFGGRAFVLLGANKDRIGLTSSIELFSRNLNKSETLKNNSIAEVQFFVRSFFVKMLKHQTEN